GLVSGLGLGNGELLQYRWKTLDHAKAADVATEFLQALDRPRREHPIDVATRNAILLFEQRAIFARVEEPQGRFVHRRALECIEGHLLHQLLEPLGNGRLATPDRA